MVGRALRPGSWHRCSRWWEKGWNCPYQPLHDEDDDFDPGEPPDDEVVPLPPPPFLLPLFPLPTDDDDEEEDAIDVIMDEEEIEDAQREIDDAEDHEEPVGPYYPSPGKGNDEEVDEFEGPGDGGDETSDAEEIEIELIDIFDELFDNVGGPTDDIPPERPPTGPPDNVGGPTDDLAPLPPQNERHPDPDVEGGEGETGVGGDNHDLDILDVVECLTVIADDIQQTSGTLPTVGENPTAVGTEPTGQPGVGYVYNWALKLWQLLSPLSPTLPELGPGAFNTEEEYQEYLAGLN